MNFDQSPDRMGVTQDADRAESDEEPEDRRPEPPEPEESEPETASEEREVADEAAAEDALAVEEEEPSAPEPGLGGIPQEELAHPEEAEEAEETSIPTEEAEATDQQRAALREEAGEQSADWSGEEYATPAEEGALEVRDEAAAEPATRTQEPETEREEEPTTEEPPASVSDREASQDVVDTEEAVEATLPPAESEETPSVTEAEPVVEAEEEAPAEVEAPAEKAEAAPSGDGEVTALAPEEVEEEVVADPFAGPGDWYVIHTYAGYENKVKTNLESRIQTMQMQDKIFNVVIPLEDVMEIKGGRKQVVQKKVFPGYLLVRMVYDDDSWYVVRNTPGVTGFVSSGTGQKPTPLPRDEVEKFLAPAKEEAKPAFRLEFEEGDVVRIISGPFADFNGTISEINLDQSKLKVLVNIFDRETPVELSFDQVARV